MDDSKKQNKKKTKSETSEETSSDSDTLLHDMRCNACDLDFSSIKTYKYHVKSKKHKKNAEAAKFVSKLMLSDSDRQDDSESDVEDEDSKEMYCDICDKNMSGYLPYIAHLKGSQHAKNKKKKKLKEEMKGMPEILENENRKSNENDDEILPDLFAHCKICQKAFSGPEPFHMHLKSVAHCKKVKHTKALEALKAKPSEGGSKSDEADFFSNCSVCNKSFSGHVPYQIHMQSNIHKKNLQKMKIVEEMKKYFSTAENAYICQECSKKFTDPKNFKYHLSNNNHEKRNAKKALKEFLESNPEIRFVAPLKDEVNPTEESDNDGDEYYLVCKLCHVSFSGPESAEAHVRSKKHTSLKKNRLALKILKQQKANTKDLPAVSDKKEVSEDNVTGNEENEHISNDSIETKRGYSRKSRLSSEDDFEVI